MITIHPRRKIVAEARNKLAILNDELMRGDNALTPSEHMCILAEELANIAGMCIRSEREDDPLSSSP